MGIAVKQCKQEMQVLLSECLHQGRHEFMTASVLLLLQLQLPSSALVEGNVHWSPKNNTDFDYQAKGKLRVERQVCQVSPSAFQNYYFFFQFCPTSSRLAYILL